MIPHKYFEHYISTSNRPLISVYFREQCDKDIDDWIFRWNAYHPDNQLSEMKRTRDSEGIYVLFEIKRRRESNSQ